MKSRRIEGNKVPERERSKNKENAELKRENHRLKRELSRLRKQVGQLLDVQDGWGTLEESAPVSNLAGKQSGSLPACESCSSTDLVTIDLPIGALVICKQCKHRRKA